MKKKMGRWIFGLLILVVLVTVFAGKNGLINLYYNIHRDLVRQRVEIVRLKAEIDSLTIVKHRLESDSTYIEKIAREKLGMARKDETIYRFSNEKKP
jgi:cell division protein FtsB